MFAITQCRRHLRRYLWTNRCVVLRTNPSHHSCRPMSVERIAILKPNRNISLWLQPTVTDMLPVSLQLHPVADSSTATSTPLTVRMLWSVIFFISSDLTPGQDCGKATFSPNQATACPHTIVGRATNAHAAMMGFVAHFDYHQ